MYTSIARLQNRYFVVIEFNFQPESQDIMRLSFVTQNFIILRVAVVRRHRCKTTSAAQRMRKIKIDR